MTRLRQIGLRAGAIALIAVVGMRFYRVTAAVSAQVPPRLVEQVRASCPQLKIRLQQLGVQDALNRVNYGQAYESLSLNVIVPTNTRLVANGLNPVELISLSDDYDKALTKFRQAYVLYEEKLTELKDSDCRQQPELFYQKLVKIRMLRHDLNGYSGHLRQLVEAYQLKFKELMNEKAAKR